MSMRRIPSALAIQNVTVEKQGFRKQVVGPIEVNVQARAEVNISLHVGQIAETITVTSEGPQLETETSELGREWSAVNKPRTPPLNGRNFAQLAQLAAGVAPAEPGSRTGRASASVPMVRAPCRTTTCWMASTTTRTWVTF